MKKIISQGVAGTALMLAAAATLNAIPAAVGFAAVGKFTVAAVMAAIGFRLFWCFEIGAQNYQEWRV